MIFKKTRRKEIFPQNTTFQRSNLFSFPSFLLSFSPRSTSTIDSSSFFAKFSSTVRTTQASTSKDGGIKFFRELGNEFRSLISDSTFDQHTWLVRLIGHNAIPPDLEDVIRPSDTNQQQNNQHSLSLSLFLSVAVTPLERRSMKKKENKRMVGKEEGTRMDGIRGIFLSSRNDHAAHWTLYLLGSLRGERQVSRARREVDHLRHRSLAPNHPDNSYRATHWQSLSAERTNFSSLFLTPFVNLDWSFSKHKFSRSILVIFGGIPQLLILHLHSEWIWVRRWVTLEIIFRRMKDFDNLIIANNVVY